MTDSRVPASPETNDRDRINPWRVIVILLWVFCLILGACFFGAAGQNEGDYVQNGLSYGAINFFVAGLLFTVFGFVILVRWLFYEFAAWKARPRRAKSPELDGNEALQRVRDSLH